MSMQSMIARSVPMAILLAGTVGTAHAQFECGVAGPDGVVGAISGGANFTHAGDIDAFSLAAQTCNVGAGTMTVQASTPAHPILTMNLYRLSTADGAMRIEQIGMSWNFHMF